MNAVKVSEGIHCLPINLESYKLFEGMWPMPHGISINAYVVEGDKTALIDLIEDVADKANDFQQELYSIDLNERTIDYLIINHMEPDHTSWLPKLIEQNPNLEIYLTKKAAAVLKSFFAIESNVHIVANGDQLDLGQGKVLHFYETPNIHWPETMMTYEQSSGVLFSCDAFGSYGTVDGIYFDDQLSEEQQVFFHNEALRYYANIVASFSTFVTKAISKLSDLEIKVIAPSHGIIWRKDPQVIIDSYSRFARYMKGPAEAEITLIWSSMYGNTAKIVDTIIEQVRSTGMTLHVHRVPEDHVGVILASAWRSSGIILGMPTYEYEMFPPMSWVLDMFRRKKLLNKKVLRFGSAGWSGGAQRELDRLNEKLKWDFLEPIEWFGAPGQEEKQRAIRQSQELVNVVRDFCAAQTTEV